MDIFYHSGVICIYLFIIVCCLLVWFHMPFWPGKRSNIYFLIGQSWLANTWLNYIAESWFRIECMGREESLLFSWTSTLFGFIALDHILTLWSLLRIYFANLWISREPSTLYDALLVSPYICNGEPMYCIDSCQEKRNLPMAVANKIRTLSLTLVGFYIGRQL